MDFATVVGLMVGVFMVFIGIVKTDLNLDNIRSFTSYESMAIVVGGTLGSLLISFPAKKVLNMIKVVTKVFFHRSRSPNELIEQLVRYAEIARRDGILALENVKGQIKDDFLERGIMLAVDGTDPEFIEEIMATELAKLEERHMTGKRILDILTKYAPAWGMIGTLIGLILMLTALSTPAVIGPNMAIALVTTLYGAIMANFVFGPIADKLAQRSQEEVTLKEIVMRGVISIQTGDNPRIVRQKLKIYLPPSLRRDEE